MRAYPLSWLQPISLVAALAISQSLFAASSSVQELQVQWAHVNYELVGKAQLEAFAELQSDADDYADAHADSADGWIWSGIIKSSYAGKKGGLGGLSLAKQARADLEKALALDPLALNGSALTSLGTLYYSVPGWPIAYGDDKKAEQLLQQALEIDPAGIDSNYFYAGFLASQGDNDGARRYYQKAAMAPPRPHRALADSGRQREIAEALQKLR